MKFILTDYITSAIATATFYKLDDGSFAGRIPVCVGVLTFGSSLRACE